MFLWHIYHLFPSKYWHHSNIVSLHIYHSFPSKILASFECSSVIYLPFISLKSTDIIRIWFRPIFTINFPQKFLNHFDMILSLVYDLSKILASFEYGFDTYLPFASHKSTGIIWIWLCYIFAIYLLQKYWHHLDMVLLHIWPPPAAMEHGKAPGRPQALLKKDQNLIKKWCCGVVP